MILEQQPQANPRVLRTRARRPVCSGVLVVVGLRLVLARGSQGVIGLGASIDYLSQFNIDKVANYIKSLMNYASQAMKENIPALTIFGNAKEKTGIISFVVEGTHSLDLGTMLGLKKYAIRTGNLCAQPLLRHLKHETICRLSFGIYSTKEEIDGFVKALNDTLHLLN